MEGKSGKKTKVTGAPSSRAVCQVEDCKADLSNAKDYHRRHKVCSVHAKATTALVGNVMQRFCQQCSRLLFDLGFLLFIARISYAIPLQLVRLGSAEYGAARHCFFFCAFHLSTSS